MENYLKAEFISRRCTNVSPILSLPLIAQKDIAMVTAGMVHCILVFNLLFGGELS
jgi:hypothetical protein